MSYYIAPNKRKRSLSPPEAENEMVLSLNYMCDKGQFEILAAAQEGKNATRLYIIPYIT